MKNNKIVTIDNFKKETGIHFTEKHSGKMSGMISLSTSCLGNKFCQAYQKDKGKVCSKCFAAAQMKMYKNMNTCFQRNADVLTTRILDKDEWPVLNVLYARLESFGDLQNETQLINYFNLCKRNPNTMFALWTKNMFIVDSVLKSGYKKPSNLNIVVSSHYLNKVVDVEQYDWVDRVFTVYDKDFIKENDVEINCGALSCMNCLKCYKKSKKHFYINEKLK